MKHLQTKTLTSKRRIAAHLLTTSAIAILGVQTAGAITVTNPTITGYGTTTRCQINTTSPAGFQTADSSSGGGADKVDMRVVSNGVNVGQDSRFVFKFGAQSVGHFTKITSIPSITNGPLTLEWVDTPGTNVVASLNVPLADLHAAGGECATAAIQAGFNPNPNQAPVANAGPDQSLLYDFAGTGTAQSTTLDASASTDADGDTLTYSWVQQGGPLNVIASGANTANPVINQPSASGTAIYRVTVTDPTGDTDTDDVSITWTANQAPNITAPATQSPSGPVLAGSAVVLSAGTSSDPDGSAVTYQWVQTGGPSVTLDDPTSANPSFPAPAGGGTVTFELRVSDGINTSTRTISAAITILPSPIANAGPDFTLSDVSSGSIVTLDGSGSSDPQGDPITYAWTQVSGPSVAITGDTSVAPSFAAPQTGTYVFSLVVNDGTTSSAPNTVAVTVNVNDAPTADAGNDQTLTAVVAGTIVTLGGTGTDPDGDTLTYAWSQDSGPSVVLTGANTANPTFPTPAQDAVMVFSLIVNDRARKQVVKKVSPPDTVTITTTLNAVPIASAGADQTLFGLTDGDTITLDGTGSTDGDSGDSLTYTWTQTSGPTVTLTGANTATPSFAYNSGGGKVVAAKSGGVAAGGDDAYQFSLVVSDGKESSSADTVDIDVFDNRAPDADAGTDQTGINAGETVSLNGSGSSDADGDSLTYAWTQVSGPTAALSSATAANPTFTAPDVSAAATLVYQLIVSDGKVFSSADTVSIAVQPTGSITIIQTVQGSDNSFAFISPITALNASLQTINGNGQLVAQKVNTGTYTVTAADMKGKGYALTDVSCNDGNSSVDVSKGVATIVLAPGEDVICTFTSVNSREAASRSIAEYVGTRNTLILSHQPSRSRRIDRLKGQSARGSITAGGLALPGVSNLPIQVAMNGSDASFAASLSSARSSGGPRAGSVSAGKGSVDVWGEAYLTDFNAGGRDGHFSIMYGGVDYMVSDRVLVGGLVQLDNFKQSGEGGIGGVGAGEGDGFMAGPYVTARVTDNVYVDARAAWGSSDNVISPLGSFSDSFDTKRSLYSGSLTGEFEMGGGLFTPTMSVRHIGETQQAYTDQLGVAIPEQDISQGELSFAPRIERSVEMTGGWTMRPHATLEGIYTFGDNASALLGSDTRARVEAGVDWSSASGVNAGISVYADGIGADNYDARGIRISLSYTMK